MPVMKCLARMELNGIGFSDTECDRLKSILQAKLRTLEEEAYRLANHSFSLTSPDEVAMVIYIPFLMFAYLGLKLFTSFLSFLGSLYRTETSS